MGRGGALILTPDMCRDQFYARQPLLLRHQLNGYLCANTAILYVPDSFNRSLVKAIPLTLPEVILEKHQ